MSDPLAILRGLTVTDQALLAAGLDEDQRLAVWGATLDALIEQTSYSDVDLGIAPLVLPGRYLLLEGRDGQPERVEVGTPFVTVGPETLRVPLRRFGSDTWDLDGGSWAPGWWERVKAAIHAPHEWDMGEDHRQVVQKVAQGFEQVWREGRWPQMGWWRARPEWVEWVFPACHDAMKRGLRRALADARSGDPILHVPVLANGTQLTRVTKRNLSLWETTLFAPSEAGYRAFLENVVEQRVPRATAMSMAFSWWERIYDGERP